MDAAKYAEVQRLHFLKAFEKLRIPTWNGCGGPLTKLPKLRIRLVPDLRCMRCGQGSGYVEEKSTLCLGCLNISLLRFVKKRFGGTHG